MTINVADIKFLTELPLFFLIFFIILLIVIQTCMRVENCEKPHKFLHHTVQKVPVETAIKNVQP
jgi:hypothetical protein